MTSLKTAVVGVGALGRHHARILSQFDDVDLIAVTDPCEETGQRVASQCGTQWVADYRDMLEQVEAVSIAAPTTMHLRIASDCLERGIPVLVEKPLACNVDEGQTLVALAQTNHTLLQVGHVERFNPATRAATDLCGQPKYIKSERVSPYSFRSTDIGIVHDLMIHDLDLILSLVASPIRHVDAFGISVMGDHEDSVQARLHFENGCIVDLTASRVCPFARRAMQIWSDRGCVTVDFTTREVTRYAPSERLTQGVSPVALARRPDADVEQLKKDVFGSFLTVEEASVSDADALTAELREFVDCVQTGQTPTVDGRQALRALQVAERVLDSVANHQWNAHAAGPIGPFILQPARRRAAA